MPAVFEKLGIRFDYPENWQLDESDALGGSGTISVVSPVGAFWSITVHERGLSPQSLVDGALSAMRQEYDNLDAEPIDESMLGHDLVGYDLNFFCLDLTNTAYVRSYCTDRGTYLLLAQVEDRDLKPLADVFRAITTSLLR